MITARLFTATATPTTLLALSGLATELRGHATITLQAGAAALNYGDRASQPMVLAIGATIQINIGSLKDIYVTGSSTAAMLITRTHG